MISIILAAAAGFIVGWLSRPRKQVMETQKELDKMEAYIEKFLNEIHRRKTSSTERGDNNELMTIGFKALKELHEATMNIERHLRETLSDEEKDRLLLFISKTENDK